MSNLSLSVIICAYTEDRWDDLVAAVKSVRAQDTPPMEIVVVIDHHPPLAQRARVALPDVVVIENQE
ncbi:MAG TPA: glycosyltransferase, partial [Chloroflexota bacterium]|nr:glycosyltransferase [Chloroflexota bacterium]